MDSGTSSSMQSSSGGGDEEYDSRADQSMLSNRHVNSPILAYNPPPPPPQKQKTNFDTLLLAPNQLDPLQQPQNLNNVCFDVLLRHPDTNPNLNLTGLSEIMASASAPPPPPPPPQQSDLPSRIQPEARQSAGNIDNGNGKINNGSRNPRKRSRASRRAPTTVLTTDASNFRAMVQEFTGIPNPPLMFSGSAPVSLFPRTNIHNTTSANGLGLFDLAAPSLLSLPAPYTNLLSSCPPKLITPASSSSSPCSLPPFVSPILAASSMNGNKEPSPLFNIQSLQPRHSVSSDPTERQPFFASNDERQNPKTASHTLDILSSSLPSPCLENRRSDNNANGGHSVGPPTLEFRGGNNKAAEDAVLKEAFRVDHGMMESWISASD